MKAKSIAAALIVSTFAIVEFGFIPQGYSANLPDLSSNAPHNVYTDSASFAVTETSEGLTLVDEPTNSYAVFPEGGFSDVPSIIGKVIWKNGFAELVPEESIQSADRYYIITNPQNANSLQVIERLSGGGFGRLLRYRGDTQRGKWVDLEFVYTDTENEITILDHASGKFYRTTFTGDRENPGSVYPSKSDEGGLQELVATFSGSLKYLLHGHSFSIFRQPRIHRLHSQFESLLKTDFWTERLVRGPPLGEVTL